jgi:hypothetical protein
MGPTAQLLVVLNPELRMLLKPSKIAHIPAPFHEHLTLPGTSNRLKAVIPFYKPI